MLKRHLNRRNYVVQPTHKVPTYAINKLLMQEQVKRMHTNSANSLCREGESTRQSGFFSFDDLPFRLLNTCIVAGTSNAKVLPDHKDQCRTTTQINLDSA